MSISTKQETLNTTKETLPLHHRNIYQSLRCIANVPFYNIGQIKFLISSITWPPLVSTSTTNADLSVRIAQQASPVALLKQLQAMYRVPWRVKTLWKTPESPEDWRRCERLLLLSKFCQADLDCRLSLQDLYRYQLSPQYLYKKVLTHQNRLVHK